MNITQEKYTITCQDIIKCIKGQFDQCKIIHNNSCGAPKVQLSMIQKPLFMEESIIDLQIMSKRSTFLINLRYKFPQMLIKSSFAMKQLMNKKNRDSFRGIKYSYIEQSKFVLISVHIQEELDGKSQTFCRQYIKNMVNLLKVELNNIIKQYWKAKHKNNQKNMRGSDQQMISKQKINESQYGQQASKNMKILQNFRKIIDKHTCSFRKSTNKHIISQHINPSSQSINNNNQKSRKNNIQAYQKFLKKLGTKDQLKNKQNIVKIIRFQKIHSIECLNHQSIDATLNNKIIADFFIVKGSLFKQTHEIINKQSEQELQLEQNFSLFQKRAYNSKNKHPSFLNQLSIINFIRYYSCEDVADYYLKESEIMDSLNQIDSIFIKLYNRNFNLLNHRLKKRIHILLFLTRGIDFLNSHNIIHRDLKPANIMLNQQNNPKIIDFGSACSALPSKLRIPTSENLRTTRGYNLTYSQIDPFIKNILNIDQFQRHINFDVYALGVLMKPIIQNNNNQQYIPLYIDQNLKWLQEKCLEQNPYDRVPINTAFGFIKFIWGCIKSHNTCTQ